MENLHSKMINIPVNLVNEEKRSNRYMKSYTVKELLDVLMRGQKIDISKFYQARNASPHVEYELTFVNRVQA